MKRVWFLSLFTLPLSLVVAAEAENTVRVNKKSLTLNSSCDKNRGYSLSSDGYIFVARKEQSVSDCRSKHEQLNKSLEEAPEMIDLTFDSIGRLISIGKSELKGRALVDPKSKLSCRFPDSNAEFLVLEEGCKKPFYLGPVRCDDGGREIAAIVACPKGTSATECYSDFKEKGDGGTSSQKPAVGTER